MSLQHQIIAAVIRSLRFVSHLGAVCQTAQALCQVPDQRTSEMTAIKIHSKPLGSFQASAFRGEKRPRAVETHAPISRRHQSQVCESPRPAAPGGPVWTLPVTSRHVEAAAAPPFCPLHTHSDRTTSFHHQFTQAFASRPRAACSRRRTNAAPERQPEEAVQGLNVAFKKGGLPHMLHTGE